MADEHKLLCAQAQEELTQAQARMLRRLERPALAQIALREAACRYLSSGLKLQRQAAELELKSLNRRRTDVGPLKQVALLDIMRCETRERMLADQIFLLESQALELLAQFDGEECARVMKSNRDVIKLEADSCSQTGAPPPSEKSD